MDTQNKISIILGVIYFVGLVAILVCSIIAMIGELNNTSDDYEEIVSNDNRECIDYLNKIKAESLTYPYALLNASVITIVFLFIFCLLYWSGTLQLHPGIMFLIILVLFVCIWCFTYKVFGCFLTRSICGGTCDKKDED